MRNISLHGREPSLSTPTKDATESRNTLQPDGSHRAVDDFVSGRDLPSRSRVTATPPQAAAAFFSPRAGNALQRAVDAAAAYIAAGDQTFFHGYKKFSLESCTLVANNRHAWAPIVHALCQVPEELFERQLAKRGHHWTLDDSFNGVLSHAKAVRDLLGVLSANEHPKLFAALERQWRGEIILPNDPYGLKMPGPYATATRIPRSFPDVVTFISQHNLSGKPVAATGQSRPREALLAHAVRERRSDSPYLKSDRPLVVNTLPHSVELMAETLSVRHRWHLAPGETCRLPEENFTSVGCSSGAFINLYVENERLETLALRIESEPRAISVVNEGANYGQFMIPPKLDDAVRVPPIMHTVWLGGLLPTEYHERIKTFRQQNPEFVHILWTDLGPRDFNKSRALQAMQAFCASEGIALLNVDATLYTALQDEGVADLYEQYRLHRQYAGASDIVRLAAFLAMGGVYADADRTCVQPLDALRIYDLVLASESCVPKINDFFMASPEHPFIKKYLQEINRSRERKCGPLPGGLNAREDTSVMRETGPGSLEAAYRGWDASESRVLNMGGRSHWGGNPFASVVTRTNDLSWKREARAKQSFVADATETPAQREERLTTCALDDWRRFDDCDWSRFPELASDEALCRRIMARVGAFLVQGATGPARGKTEPINEETWRA